ncbi:MAG: ATP-dependent DNA helicase PcrA [Gemmatimonadetes bacterium]|nr:ATP-dependent DNA helicase PcrA [Gemmatimonadota bacterium]
MGRGSGAVAAHRHGVASRPDLGAGARAGRHGVRHNAARFGSLNAPARRLQVESQDYLSGLNPEQRQAVAHFEGPILVLAGAGSGKTRVLTTRVAHLIHEHGVDPAAILAVTFTNKAAGEMRGRIRRLLGTEPAGMWVGTFHAIGARLLRRHALALGWSPNFSIFDSDQTERELKRVLERLGFPPKKWHPQAVHSAISGAKNQLVDAPAYAATAADAFTRVVAAVYPEYQRSLREQNAFDFDDLLVQPVALFEGQPALLGQYRERFGFLLVDEYQDTNHAQYQFLHLLATAHGNLMVVGDDDQSIYGWRGADIRNILDFEKDFPNARVVRLEQNYRSTARILAAANAVIAQNVKRKGKTLRTVAEPGERLVLVEALDERDEADWIGGEIEARLRPGSRTPRDFVVLYRTNAQSRALEEAFRRRDLPYQIVGGTRFYERREIMDVLAYLRLISNPRDNGAFDRIVNYPRRGIGDTSRTQLLEWAASQGSAPLEAALRADEAPALRGGAASALRGFAALIQRFTALASHLRVGELVEKLLAEIKLVDALRDEGPEGDERIENVRELVAGAHEWDARTDRNELEAGEGQDATALDLFLQKVSLLTDVDRHDPSAQAVTLMTLHNAKGLEFPCVFVSGLEDGLFPLARSFDEPDTLEEERRLFYVGITRGEERVYLTRARSRRRGGEVLSSVRSSFLEPIPRELLEERVTPALQRLRQLGEVRWRSGTPDRFGGFAGERAAVGDVSGVYLDYSEAQEAPRFIKGERVRHPQFGRGVIRELTGLGRELKAVIDFEAYGRKKVVLRYANLQKEL